MKKKYNPHLEGHVLDPGLVPGGTVELRDGEALAGGVADDHALEHLGLVAFLFLEVEKRQDK